MFEKTSSAGSKWSGDSRSSMKKRSRSEIFSTLALPLIVVAVRKLESKSSPLNFAINFPAESRKVKSPSRKFTRRTSGVKTGAGVSARAGSLGATATMGATGEAADGATAAGLVTCPLSLVTGFCCAAGSSGRRHFPEEFCAQTTSGLINEIWRMTSRSPKSDQNCTRS